MSNQSTVRRPHIILPLTGLSREMQDRMLRLCEQLADACEQILGVRAHVPKVLPWPTDRNEFPRFASEIHAAACLRAEREMSLVIALAVAPSTGMGVELGIAEEHGVPGILLCDFLSYGQCKLSPMVLGKPMFGDRVIVYDDHAHAVLQFRAVLERCKSRIKQGSAVHPSAEITVSTT